MIHRYKLISIWLLSLLIVFMLTRATTPVKTVEKVKYITMTETEYRTCIVRSRKALFHTWEDIYRNNHSRYNSITNEVTPIIEQCTVAIIEYEDGVVTECYPYEIKFTDNKLKDYYFPEEASK